MKKQRSVRPEVESLENVALLSGGLLAHAAVHAIVPAVVEATPATGVHLRGGIGSGRGYVSPMGLVTGSYNLVQRTLTLSNGRGGVELQLGNEHINSHLVRFGSWQIVAGAGQYSNWQGSGSGAFTLVIAHGRAVASSAAFY